MKPFTDISPDQFNYALPDAQIAAFPTTVRDESRLLVKQKEGTLLQDTFNNISGYLDEGSHLFFNNSRVIPARLIFSKNSGSRIEIFCLKPVSPSDYALSLSATKTCSWECMVGNLKKFTPDSLQLKTSDAPDSLTLRAEKLGNAGNAIIIKFTWNNDKVSFAELLSMLGQTPLPPYIKRKPEAIDRERYQTVYSKFNGSVAAPTAGLHFTDRVFEKLSQKRITCHEITLHVGAGTFQPIKSNRVKDHEMHAEFFILTPELVQLLSDMPGRVACVGTTTVRTLESAYWLGVKILHNKNLTPLSLHLDQWEPYKLPAGYTMKQSFEALGNWLEKQNIREIMASTRLMIVPGYRFNIVNTLITNFHQPRSTLLLLIAAFIGESWKETYDYALKQGFRFLSYGDSSLLFDRKYLS